MVELISHNIHRFVCVYVHNHLRRVVLGFESMLEVYVTLTVRELDVLS